MWASIVLLTRAKECFLKQTFFLKKGLNNIVNLEDENNYCPSVVEVLIFSIHQEQVKLEILELNIWYILELPGKPASQTWLYVLGGSRRCKCTLTQS